MTSSNDELAFYITEAKRAPRLERDEETALARRWKEGDRAAGDALARANLRHVVAVAMKYRRYGVPVSELIAEGNFGVVHALGKFEPERGLRFGTYAKHWVRAQVLACVIRSFNIFGGRSGLVRPQLFFRLRRERARIAALLGEGNVTHEALAERMDMSVKRLRRTLDCLEIRGVPLDAPLGHREDERFVDTLVSADDPEQTYFHGQRRRVASSAVASALRALDSRELYIARVRLMAPATEQLSLSEIAATLGISRERARQLEERAKLKLGRCAAIQQNAHLREWFAE